MQARADIIALDMVRLADGRTQAQITAASANPNAVAYLNNSAARNDIDPAKLTVVWGIYKTKKFTPTTASQVPNAVQVTASEPVHYFFAGAVPGAPKDSTTTRSAIASYGEPVGGFSIGSFGASLSSANSGVLNSILTPLLGNPAGVNALSYQGLAGATLGVGDLATELGLLNPDAALTTDVGTEQFLVAAANVLERQGNAAQANILRGMITPQVKAFGPISIGDVVTAQSGTEDAALASRVNALDLLTATAFGSRCTDPNDLGSCSALSLPGISTSLPLASLSGNARVIQGKVSVFGPVGASGSTNQTQVGLNFALNSQQVGQCQPANILDLKCVLGGLLGTINFVDATVSANLTVKLADATGTIAALDCGSPKGIDVSTHTGLYSVTGTVTITFGKRGLLGGVLGPTLGSITLSVNNNQTDVYDLSQFDVPPAVLGQTVDQTGNGNIGLSGVSMTTTGGTGVLGTLGNLGITNTVVPLLNTLVNPMLAQLDNQILGPLTDLLGVNVAGSDVTPLQIGCAGQGLHLVA
jgi:uncharacterized membrane protein